MPATIEFMYATGPLVDTFGEPLHHAQAPVPAATAITVRCIDRHGWDLAAPITVSPDRPLATEALRLVIRGHDHGTCSADRFAHVVFTAMQEIEDRPSPTARDRAIHKRLRALDHLAIVGLDHDATIPWGPVSCEP